jgi:hypothetical protein
MTLDPEGAPKDSGQVRLEELGYKQELSRRLGLLSSVASSFATIAYMMGITGILHPLFSTKHAHLHLLSAVSRWSISELATTLTL